MYSSCYEVMGWGVAQTAATAGNGGPEAVPYQVLSQITKKVYILLSFPLQASKNIENTLISTMRTKGNTRTICF
jgi:hypothetical protein